ncbi:RNA-directed DNA polymerase from mobile element jockey-like [Rhizophagus clarus]|uniref:RNA-directed DNA polymerase from mobile element jockey-like n=1 Tax=Rhizophagus clarus TaxID=94130 RepID=A0A8H3MB54_9GLOM|nr:RNA-directed DNA polymerase from mobile element jockey-like [Rhizophagus clarus]
MLMIVNDIITLISLNNSLKIYLILLPSDLREDEKYKTERIKFFVDKQSQELVDHKRRIINSVLNRQRKCITLDKILICNNEQMELCLDPDVIDKEVTNHFQNTAGKKFEESQMQSCWQQQYQPIEWIDPRWYTNLMQEITIEEWHKVIIDLPKEKASKPSKISNELLQHMGLNMFKLTLQLANLCLTIDDIPAEWRDALLYPIPHQLTKTRPITLLETMRKAVVKIITQKLSHIIANNNILKGGNHAALPSGSTEVLIRIMNLIIEDAKVKKKPLWILFQDLSKVYDRVDIKMLKLALNRIKIPKRIVQLLVNLFSNSRKAVITKTGTTPFYKALIGIDQGEVISLLLWTIYYDPLLCEINKLQLDYIVNQSILIWTIDISWITDTSYKLESILQIADEFNKLNNIQINPEKFALMTNDTNALKDKILGAWMNLNLSKVYVFNQCKNIITGYNKIIRNKQLTDKMMRYIYNTVIIPSIEYKSQYTILNDKQVATLNILAHTLFKKKTNLVMAIPNCMIYSSLGYAIKDISTIQLQRQVTRLHNQLQNKGLLGMLSKLSIICLQQETLSVNNILTEWKIHLKDLKIKYNLIASTLAIMYDNNLTFQSNIEHKIMGGQLPITQVLNPDLLFKDRLNYHLQHHNIYFLSQIMAADEIHLLTYSDLQIQLEQHCIINIAISRKVQSEFTISRQYHLQGSKVSDKILRKKQWVAFYSDKLNSSHFGRILSNDQTPMVEHWIHNINDDSIFPLIQALVLNKCTGCELKDIELRSKRKTANNRCLLFIDKGKDYQC